MEFDREASESEYSASGNLKIGFDQRTGSVASTVDDRQSIITTSNEDSEYILIEKEIAEQKKPKPPVARIIPAFIDLIIFLAQIGVFGGFLYMAYIYGKLHDRTCMADA